MCSAKYFVLAHKSRKKCKTNYVLVAKALPPRYWHNRGSNIIKSGRLTTINHKRKLVRQSQIVQSVMYSYDAVISSYITPAIHSWEFDDET